MGYDNNNGGCCGGWGFPFGGFMNGFGGLGFDALLLKPVTIERLKELFADRCPR